MALLLLNGKRVDICHRDSRIPGVRHGGWNITPGCGRAAAIAVAGNHLAPLDRGLGGGAPPYLAHTCRREELSCRTRPRGNSPACLYSGGRTLMHICIKHFICAGCAQHFLHAPASDTSAFRRGFARMEFAISVTYASFLYPAPRVPVAQQAAARSFLRISP